MKLSFRTGARAGEIVEVRDSPFTIGRDAECDLVLDDERVSRRHASIRLDSGGAELTDLQSANGTFVDGARVTAPTRLSGGELLRIGGIELAALGEPSAPPAAPGGAAPGGDHHLSSPAETRGRRRALLVLAPLGLFAAIALGVYGLAEWHVFQPTTDVAVEELPPGDATAGAQVWIRSCASCHGADAEGGIGPALSGNTELSDAEVAAVIRAGRGAMPAALVDGQDEADVIAYLRQDVLGAETP